MISIFHPSCICCNYHPVVVNPSRNSFWKGVFLYSITGLTWLTISQKHPTVRLCQSKTTPASSLVDFISIRIYLAHCLRFRIDLLSSSDTTHHLISEDKRKRKMFSICVFLFVHFNHKFFYATTSRVKFIPSRIWIREDEKLFSLF